MDSMKDKEIWVEIGHVGDFPRGSGKTIRFDGLELALFHLRSGKFKAVENRCPHKNGVLAEGIVSGDYVFCPLHDRKIELSSGLVQVPDSGCIQIFPVYVGEDGAVLISRLPVAETIA